MNIFDKAKDMLTSDKAEEISDKALDAAAAAANKVTGSKHADKVEGVRDAVDARVGNEGRADRA